MSLRIYKAHTRQWISQLIVPHHLFHLLVFSEALLSNHPSFVFSEAFGTPCSLVFIGVFNFVGPFPNT